MTRNGFMTEQRHGIYQYNPDSETKTENQCLMLDRITTDAKEEKKRRKAENTDNRDDPRFNE